MEHFGKLGLWSGSIPAVDGHKVMDRVRSIVRKAYEKDLPETFEQIGISVITGAASFLDHHQIKINGRTLSADKFIIASGTQPLIPPIDGLQDVEYLTNENLYELDDLPESIVIMGGGVDGLEYASAFGRLGVKTTLVEMGSRLLPMIEPELTNTLSRILESDGIRLLTGAKVVSLRRGQEGITLRFEQAKDHFGEIQAARVLVAIGRKPDLDGLMLEKAGVALHPQRDNHRQKTSDIHP